MSWTTLSNKKIKGIRKPRVCHGCSTKYLIGTTMHKNVSVDGGDLISTYWCEICEEFLSDKWKDIDEGIGEGDCWEWGEYKEYREKWLKEHTDATEKDTNEENQQ